MAKPNVTESVSPDIEELKRKWLDRLTLLVDSIETWARELGWSTRRISKDMKESEFGPYKAPALMLQDEFTKGLLEPISEGMITGLGGRVDLYMMPAYDDVAYLLSNDGEWMLHHTPPGLPAVGSMEDLGPETLSKETLEKILACMKEYDAKWVGLARKDQGRRAGTGRLADGGRSAPDLREESARVVPG